MTEETMHPDTTKFESALRWQVLQWIEKIGEADVLVGIPCYNNEDTIAHVVSTAGKGLAEHFGDKRTAILVSDGGSLDDTREQAYAAEIPESVQRRVSIYRGLPGKGTSFRAVFEAAVRLKARAIIVVDSDLKSITPAWIYHLATPILADKADYVSPLYSRHKYDGTITNMIVYPMTRALFGIDVRQPIGGDFGFNGDLARAFAREPVWDTDVARFGIDIWITLTAICMQKRIAQAYLGTKVHNVKDPAADLAPMFRQVVSTLFYVATHHEEHIRRVDETAPADVVTRIDNTLDIPDMTVDFGALDREFLDGVTQFEPMYQQTLDADDFRQLKHLVWNFQRGNATFPSMLWARILYDFLSVYRLWSRNRRRLVDMLVPLYFGRVGGYCREVENMSNEEAEAVVQEQAEVFEREKAHYLEAPV